MEMHPLRVFLTVAAEKSFSRAAEKLLRTQPAISLSIQRLETELGEKLIDRSAKDLLLTDAGKIVLEYARRFENLQGDLENALAELRDKSAGRLTIGANESSTLYLLDHIERYRRRYPKIKVQIRRSLSSKIPGELLDGDLELGILTFDPEDERLISKIIFTDHLAFIISPSHRFATRGEISITELGMETFIAHNVVSPYRGVVIREFQRNKVPLNMDSGNAHRRGHPQNGAAQRRRRVPAAHVRQRRVDARHPVRGEGERNGGRPQNPPGISGKAGA